MGCPCKECLKLALCIQNLNVFCTDLARFAHDVTSRYGEIWMWRIIEESLPNANRIYSNDRKDYHHPWYRR